MKYEWRDGDFNIIGAAPWDDDTQLRTMVGCEWDGADGDVACFEELVGVYDGAIRVPDIVVKAETPKGFAPASGK
jgi:hypothetical protein